MAVLVGAVALMGPVAAHPLTMVNGYRSDPAAEVWLLNEFKTGRIGLVSPSRTAVINSPDGAVLRRPVEITSSFVDVVAWPLIRVFSAVTTRNLLVFLGLVTNGLAAAAAARALRVGRLAAAVAAIAFMYAPTLVVESRLHEALVFAFPLPLAFAVGVSLIDAPRRRAAFALGAIAGLSCYIHPYLPLYTASVAGAVSIVLLARMRWRGLSSFGQIAIAAVVVAAPVIVLLSVRRRQTLGEVSRSISDLDVFGSTPLDLVRAFGPAAAGLLVLVVAAVGVWRLPSRAPAAILALCALAGTVLSAGTYANVVGHRIPMPNRVLFAVYPVWRVVGRATVLVWFVAALGIGAAVHEVVARARVARARALPIAVVIALACAVPVGAALRHGWPRFPANETPALSRLIARRGGVVAVYPLFGQDNSAMGPYLLGQVFHGRPLFNGARAGTTNALLSSVAGNPADRQTPAALQLGGVTTVVMNGDQPAPLGTVLVASVEGARVYALTPVEQPSIALWENTFAQEESGGRTWRWLPSSARLSVVASEPGAYLVQTTVESAPGVSRMVIGENTVLTVSGETTVEVCLRVDIIHEDGLVTGSIGVGPSDGAVPLGARDPRLALARAFATTVVGRCD